MNEEENDPSAKSMKTLSILVGFYWALSLNGRIFSSKKLAHSHGQGKKECKEHSCGAILKKLASHTPSSFLMKSRIVPSSLRLFQHEL